MKTVMTVRSARVDDAGGIGQIRVAAWQAAYADFMPAAYLQSLDPGANLDPLRQLILTGSGPQVLVAEHEAALVGFALVGPPRHVAAPKTSELWALNVLPTHWKQGFGGRLIQASLQEAQRSGSTSMELWCIKGNRAAETAYARQGFVPTGDVHETSQLTGVLLCECLHRRAI